MNYLNTPYEDYFFDERCSKRFGEKYDRDSVYNNTEQITIPGYDVFSKLLKTTCSLYPYDKTIEQFDLLALILIHFKQITVEQFYSLMPWAWPALLSDNSSPANTGNATKNKKNQKKGKKTALKAYPYAGTSLYYMLTPAVYEKTLSLLPDEYIVENQLSIKAPGALKGNAMHHIMTNNVPFRLLRDEKFSPFNWYEGVVLDTRKGLEESLALRHEKRVFNSSHGAASTLSKKPDGIIVTKTGDKTCYCIVEQDMGTERRPALLEKHWFYGNLFQDETACENMTVLYHCANPEAVKRVKVRAPDHAKHKTYRHSLAKLKYFMAQKGCSNIGDAWFLLWAEECRNDISLNALLSVKSLKVFLEDYMHATPDRPANDGSYEDVEDFVASIESDEKYGRSSYIYRCEKKHTAKIWNDALDFLRSDAGMYLREAILKKNLSYVVVNRILFDRYAPAILAKESHYEEVLFKRLAFTSMLNYCEPGITEEEHGKINGYYFRNIFFFHENDIRMTVFEEISQDLGGYARAKFFCDKYKGGGVPINLILLVWSDGDALSFTKKTKVERFETWDPDEPEEEFNVHVAFVNYASRKAPPFIYYEDEGKWVKRELKIQVKDNKEEQENG